MINEAPILDSAMIQRRERLAQAPPAITVEGVAKSFRIPRHRIDSLKERVIHPFRRQEYRRLQALKDISFEVRKGEFFGIVGRNGSGKSTLLKIMASIYRPDAGRVKIAGRLAPFIELGVGFNPELSSRENIVLNGVLLGLTRREAIRRLDAVLDFAELREFSELKLKNYSSGMLVRLAFSIMVQADADVMLIDEVLAVGDAAFGQKCLNAFEEMRDAGRTIVLVTHDMAQVQRFCDRAMLIHDSELQYLGDPEDTAIRYYRINFGAEVDEIRGEAVLPDVQARILDVWLENAAGARITNVEQRERFFFNCLFEVRRELQRPVFSFQFSDSQGAHVSGFTKSLELPNDAPDRLLAGQKVLISGEIENRFRPGRYHVSAWFLRDRTAGDLALHTLRLIEFTVYGTDTGAGSIELHDDVRAVIVEPGADI